MFNQREAYLRKAFLAAVAVQLLLAAAGQSAALTSDLQTAATAAPTNASLAAQPRNSSAEGPVVLSLHRPCGGEHDGFCGNGGECMYPQDSDKPFCICAPQYNGPRCLFFSDPVRSQPELEKLIGVGYAVVMLIFALAVIIYCFARRRCMKSAPLIKSAPSETSV